MSIWLFPGQPLRFLQSAPDDADFRDIAYLCREQCGYDLVTHQPLTGYRLSHHTCLQIHGVAMSLYHARLLHNTGYKPKLLAEHSLGIYAALVACKSITEEEALKLVCRHGMCMFRMSENNEYMLGCPIGLSVDPVESAARNNGVYVANYNTSRHFLLAGEKRKMESALAECQAAGAFSVSCFPCEAPLHTPLMADIAVELSAIASDYHFAEPKTPLVEHINQTALTAAAVPFFLVDELLQPVYWERTWLLLRSVGFDRCFEVGSGQALTKFNRWIDSEVDRV